MKKEYEKYFKISSDGRDEIFYQDSSCYIKLTVADFRDTVWWVGINTVINKHNGQQEKISRNQKYEVYRRISAYAVSHGVEGVYTTDFKFVNVSIEDIDNLNDILEIK